MKENNPNWKGDNVSYNCLHLWIRKYFLKPNKCSQCGKETDKLDLANVTGIYNRDFKNWEYMCRSCHMIYDDQKTKHWITRHKNVTKD